MESLTPPGAQVAAAVIPCLDEEETICPVVAAMLGQGAAEVVVVVDTPSNDGTAERVAAAGLRAEEVPVGQRRHAGGVS